MLLGNMYCTTCDRMGTKQSISDVDPDWFINCQNFRSSSDIALSTVLIKHMLASLENGQQLGERAWIWACLSPIAVYQCQLSILTDSHKFIVAMTLQKNSRIIEKRKDMIALS